MQGGSNYKWSFLIALLVFIEIDFTECAAKVERKCQIKILFQGRAGALQSVFTRKHAKMKR